MTTAEDDPMKVAQALPRFDPDFAAPFQWAAMYRAVGLQVIPGHMPGEGSGSWKRPLLAQWAPYQQALVPQATFDRWYAPDGEHAMRYNLGGVTGPASGNLMVVDLDTHKTPTAAAWWHAVLEVENSGLEPETVQQVTGGGGRQLLFRAPEGWVVPTRKTSIGVDIRGQGGFVVLPPSLHESGASYRWVPGAAPWECEIAVAPAWLLDAVLDLVAAHGGSESGSAGRVRVPSSGGDYDAFGLRRDGREEEMRDVVWRCVLELYRQAPIMPGAGDTEAIEAAYETYERRVVSRLPGDKRAGLEQEGRGPSAFKRKWRAAVLHWGSPRMVEEAAKPPPEVELPGPRASEPPPAAAGGLGLEDDFGGSKPNPPGMEKNPPVSGIFSIRPALIPLVSAFPIAGADIPRRNWVILGLLLKRSLTVLVAPPGSGKSLLTLQIAIAVAVGLPWAGWVPRAPEKVLVINAEDDLDEMRRRLFAAAQSMGVDQAALVGRIFLVENPETVVIARTDSRTKTVIRTPLIEQVVATVQAHGIGVVIADPFAETFEGDENSNSEVKWAGILWREVGRRTIAAVLLVHHTKKYASGMAGDADASRGGGALIGTARVLNTLFAMTEDEAKVMGIEEQDRPSYLRFDDAKANYSRSIVCRWFRKVSITLPNAGALEPGDEVGVLEPWVPPEPTDGLPVDAVERLLRTIADGLRREDGHPSGALYTASVKSEERWVGNPIMSGLGIDEERAKKLVKTWIADGTLIQVNYHDPSQRRNRTGLKLGQKGQDLLHRSTGGFG